MYFYQEDLTVDNTIGQRIKARREHLEMSQAELAEKIGYSDRSTIAKIEKGVNDISQSKVAEFADALRTTPAYLMGMTDDEYDYETDEDDRLLNIPIAIFDSLKDRFHDNLALVWKAWCDMEDDAARESAMMNLPDNVIPMPGKSSIPLVGTIACGTPILAEENREGDVDLPEHIHADFALRCKGDSMINARIYDGDIVYIRQQDTVEHGEIAAVLIGTEATLKRVFLFDDHITLEAENPQYRPLSYWGNEMNDVRILGKAVAFTSTVR